MGQALTDGSFKIAKPSSNASFSKEDYLQYVPLDLTYPELQGLPRDKANLWKAVVGGGVPQEHSDPCVDVHMYESKTLIYGTAQWGVNKGLAIFGPQTSFKKVEILEVLQSLKLMTGACEWN